ncbi:protein ECERIFERUM 26 [Mercurialis annua]|uniref:protein ECERIFERUM 26 n=1 Tax=Mercurialis annua TaxID=3986 RepID=UPI00215FBA6D|nr:protein ECERIFERUM 26 [Mercurialis annua]
MAEQITHICKRTVVSTKPVEAGKFVPLSVLDRLMERNHLRIVYYFQTPKGMELGETTKKLRESMSEMLTTFPVLTGRLVKGQDGHWMIKCNDAGVRGVEATAKGSVEEWLENVDKEKELTLIHWEEMFQNPYFWSTFYVQLTEFEEGGLAIGLSCFHLLADLTCAAMFIKAWADITLTGKMISPPLFHPLPPRRPGNTDPYHLPYTHLINYYKSTLEKTYLVTDTAHGYATIALLFKDPMVRACIAAARATSARNGPNPSPFQALSGLFWGCISKAKGKKYGLVDMCVCLDMRKMLGLDYGYFGNCTVYNKIQPKSSNPTVDIVEEMAKMDIEGMLDLIEWLQSNDWQSTSWMNGGDLICGNLEGVNPYFSMFEEGFAPIRVSHYVEPVGGAGYVLVVPAPPGEGEMARVVMVTLPEDEMVRLCKDDLLLGFSPITLMGLKK